MNESAKAAKKTPLYEKHVEAGARMVDFAGWLMPVQYAGIKEEHLAVRNAAGLFDVCHMGEIEVSGPKALEFIQSLTPNDASKVDVGAAQYTAFLNQVGGVIDDLIFYRQARDKYLLCVNASNTAKDLAWINKHVPPNGVFVTDLSDKTALLALQGPKSPEILAKSADLNPASIKRFHFSEGAVAGVRAIICRTGYTGEDGFEIFMDAGDAKAVWDRLMEEGRDFGLQPAGLGARDTLRLEMGYPLHGNDLDEEHTPLESNLGWICKLSKGEFMGRDVLTRQKEGGIKQKLVGLTFLERGVPRHGYELADPGTREVVGVVTSGTSSPSLGVGIALARVRTDFAKEGKELIVLIREQARKARVTQPPFHKKSA